MRFICMFLPALFAANYEIKGNEDNYKKILIYSKYCIIINFIILIGLVIAKRGSIHFEDMRTVNFYVLYLLLSCILAFFVPRVVVFCKDNFSFSIKRNNK